MGLLREAFCDGGMAVKCYTFTMNNKTIAWLSGIIGMLLIALAIYYWLTPAGSLPTFLPGYEQGVTAVHVKHGLASLIVGFLALILAWFKSAPARA